MTSANTSLSSPSLIPIPVPNLSLLAFSHLKYTTNAARSTTTTAKHTNTAINPLQSTIKHKISHILSIGPRNWRTSNWETHLIPRRLTLKEQLRPDNIPHAIHDKVYGADGGSLGDAADVGADHGQREGEADGVEAHENEADVAGCDGGGAVDEGGS